MRVVLQDMEQRYRHFVGICYGSTAIQSGMSVCCVISVSSFI
jgi:hypothetical protein